MKRASSPPFRVQIIGGGIIGMACAVELADAGCEVVLNDPGILSDTASWAAAGMLAPTFEASAEPEAHPQLFAACQQSRDLWPDWHHRIERLSGETVPFSPGPTEGLIVDEADATFMQQVAEKMATSNQGVSQLTQTKIDAESPLFGGVAQASFTLKEDGWVDSRCLIQALRSICAGHPKIRFVQAELRAYDIDTPDKILICAGWRSAHLQALIEGERAQGTQRLRNGLGHIRPTSGQMLVVAQPDPPISSVLRWRHLYMVPRGAHLVIGATVEPGVIRQGPDRDAIDHLLATAAQLIPALDSAEILQSWSGVRPASPDHAPLIGHLTELGDRSVYLASGHYRNGLLLAPLTAKWLKELLLEETVSPLLGHFSPHRFEAAGVT